MGGRRRRRRWRRKQGRYGVKRLEAVASGGEERRRGWSVEREGRRRRRGGVGLPAREARGGGGEWVGGKGGWVVDRERRVNLSREGREKRTGPKGSKPRKIQRGSADSIGGKRTRGPSDRIEAARAPRYSQCGAVPASSCARSLHAANVFASRYDDRDHDRYDRYDE